MGDDQFEKAVSQIGVGIDAAGLGLERRGQHRIGDGAAIRRGAEAQSAAAFRAVEQGVEVTGPIPTGGMPKQMPDGYPGEPRVLRRRQRQQVRQAIVQRQGTSVDQGHDGGGGDRLRQAGQTKCRVGLHRPPRRGVGDPVGPKDRAAGAVGGGDRGPRHGFVRHEGDDDVVQGSRGGSGRDGCPENCRHERGQELKPKHRPSAIRTGS